MELNGREITKRQAARKSDGNELGVEETNDAKYNPTEWEGANDHRKACTAA